MYEHHLPSLNEQRRHQFMADADARRLINTARDVEMPAPAIPDTIWAEGTLLRVRPIVSTDADRLTRLFGRLSPRSVQARFFSPIRRIPRAQLVRMVEVDHLRREALVVLSNDEIIAVARYDGCEDAAEAEIAVTVEDTWQHRGVGKRLTRRLSALAVARGYDTFVANILPDNRAALNLVRNLSPETSIRWSDGAYEALIPLRH
jgi:GNAT superfamily N-acetyltransferase